MDGENLTLFYFGDIQLWSDQSDSINQVDWKLNITFVVIIQWHRSKLTTLS